MFNRFLSQFTLALLVALPLMAEPISQEENVYFKVANLNTLPFRSKGCRCHPVRVQKYHRKQCCRKGPTGATGATGATGPAGATGATGIGPSLDYASFVKTLNQIANTNDFISFDFTSVNDNDPNAQNGTTVSPGVTVNSPTNTIFTIQVPGDYLINVGLNALTFSPNTDTVLPPNPSFAIVKNSSAVPGGSFGNSSSSLPPTFAGTSFMLASLQVGDTISIQALSPVSIIRPSAGVQAGYINFLRMGP